VRCVACSSTAVYTGSADEQVKHWVIKDGKLEQPRAYDDHDFGVTGLDVSRDENTLVVGSLDGRIRCWDMRSEKCVRDITGGSGENQSGPGDVSQVRFSVDGVRVITAGALGRLRIWDLRQGARCQSNLDLQTSGGGMQSGAVQCLSVSPKGTYVTFGTERGSVGLANLAEGVLCGLVPVHKRPVRSVGFSRDTRKVFAGCDDGYVSVLNPKVLESQTDEKETAALQHFVSVHTSWVTGVAPHPASANHFLTTSKDKTVRLWNLANKELVREWTHASSAWCVAYAPTGKFFAVGNGDNSLAVYHQEDKAPAPAGGDS
jgi:WD repeat-containing protein 61